VVLPVRIELTTSPLPMEDLNLIKALIFL